MEATVLFWINGVAALLFGLEYNLVVWSVIVYHTAMAVWYGYFLFSREEAAAPQGQSTP